MDSLLRRICFLKGCFLLYTYERNRSILSTHLSVQNALLVRLATEVKVCTLDAVEGPLDSKPFKLEKSREEWGVGEKRFLFSRRARARCYDSMHIHALVFSTALRGFSIALFSYPSFSFIISQLSTHLSFRARRKPWCPNPSRLFSIFSPFVTTHYKKNAFFFASSSWWCSLRLLFLLFLFCLFVVGLPSSSFHSFRPFHRRHDPFSNDRHAFEPRTCVPRPMRQSFPPLAQREEEERHHALQRHAAAPEAHDRHSSFDDDDDLLLLCLLLLLLLQSRLKASFKNSAIPSSKNIRREREKEREKKREKNGVCVCLGFIF